MELSLEEKKAIKDCDTIFMCLENMMSKESANDYRSSYRLIKNLINNQQKEIEEKSTILIAGSEKVKQLEKEIEELKEKNKNLIFQLKDEEKELIEVTDKIREKINYYRKYCGYDGVTMIGNTQLKELEELLEEN